MIDGRLQSTTKEAAYRLLNIDPNAVAAATKITPLLKAVGGRSGALQYLRASDNPLARRFIAIYDDITLPRFVRTRLSIEAFCIASNVEPRQLLQVIGQAVRDIGQFEAAIHASTKHPLIVEKSTALALEGDIDHVTLNMKHMGYLPAPKNSAVSISLSANANANAQAQSATVVAPSPENTIRRLVNRFNLPTTQQAALPEPKETIPVVMPRSSYQTIESSYSEEDSSTATAMSDDE